MEWTLQLLAHAFRLTKNHPWADAAVLFGGLAARLGRTKAGKWPRGPRYGNWPETQATVAFTRVLSSRRNWAVFYSYFVGGRRYGGYRMFHAGNAAQAEEAARRLKGKSFMVRYDPVKPQRSTVLEADNPVLNVQTAPRADQVN